MSDIRWRPVDELTPAIVQRSRMLVELANGDMRLVLRGADVCNTVCDITQHRGAWRLTVRGGVLWPVKQFAVIDDW